MRTWYEGHDHAYQKRKAKGQAGWDTTEEYEEFQIIAEEAFNLVNFPKHGKLLELGCGAGNMTLWFAKNGYQAYGVDIAPTAIEWAQEYAQKDNLPADFKVGNVLDLHDYSDNLFDIVFDGHCFHCIIGADREKFLASAFRVLKLGGCLIINTICGEIMKEAEERKHFDPQSRCLVYRDIATRYIGFPETIVKEIQKSNFNVMHQKIQVRKNQNDCDNLHVIAVK